MQIEILFYFRVLNLLHLLQSYKMSYQNMQKLLFLLSFIFSVTLLSAQTVTKQNIADSLEDAKLFLAMLDSLDEKPANYFELSLGIGNGSFSVNNNSVNASQAQVSKLYYTPSIGYNHKSGFGIAVTPYFTTDNGNLKTYQTAITPSYDYESNKISTGISFTKFITDTKSYTSNSTYQNDLYAYLKYTKSYIQPILSIGYAFGTFKERTFVDSITILNRRIAIFDSTKNDIKDFSISLGIEHIFNLESVFTKKGTLTFTPQVVLNAGSEKFKSTITNSRRVAAATRTNRLKSLTQNADSPFAFQSIALSLSTDYYIGNFVISPNFYIDYYLPPTAEKRLTNVFSFSVGYTFY
jgi:hypothetical protein